MPLADATEMPLVLPGLAWFCLGVLHRTPEKCCLLSTSVILTSFFRVAMVRWLLTLLQPLQPRRSGWHARWPILHSFLLSVPGGGHRTYHLGPQTPFLLNLCPLDLSPAPQAPAPQAPWTPAHPQPHRIYSVHDSSWSSGSFF